MLKKTLSNNQLVAPAPSVRWRILVKAFPEAGFRGIHVIQCAGKSETGG